MAPLILNLDTTWRRVVKFTPRPLYPRQRTQVSTEQDRWAQSRSGRFGEDKIIFPLPRLEPSNRPARSLVP